MYRKLPGFAALSWALAIPAIPAGLTPASWQDGFATAAAPQLEDRYPQRRVAFPDGVTGFADITYSTPAGFRPLTLDLYVPPRRAGVMPAIVYVHGGGWMSGHARHAGAFENWPQVLASLAARGFVVASVNYRLSAEAVSPAAALDIKSAIHWLRVNAGLYSIDKQRIGILGASAGGQLAALAGTSCGVTALEAPAVLEDPASGSCVQAVATWYGVFDFAPLLSNARPESPETRYLGCSPVCNDQQVFLASPVRHVDRTDPPFLLIHGALDRTVAPSQSVNFHAVLLEKGVKSELLLIDGADHSFIGATPEDTRAASLRALRVTMDFFERTLKPR